MSERGDLVARVEGEIVIERPVEEVFDFVADERNEPLYNPRMRRAEKTSAGPVGRGTRFRADTVSFGRSAELTIELVEYDRPTRLASSTHLAAMDIRGTLSFEPVAERTRMRWEWELEGRGILKLLDPIVARIGSRQERAIWANLARLLAERARR